MGHSGHGGGFSGGGSFGGSYDNYGHSSGTTCYCTGPWAIAQCVIFGIIFLLAMGGFITAFVIIEENKNRMFDNPVISPGEQVLWCSQKKVTLGYPTEDIRVYEAIYGQPDISSEVRNVSTRMTGSLSEESYDYKGFYFAPGSKVTIKKESSSSYASLIVIKGTKEMTNFLNDKRYSALYESPGSVTSYVLSVNEYDEYFVIVDSFDRTTYSVVVYGTATRFDVESLNEQCLPYTGTCTINEKNAPDYCAVIDYNDTKSYESVKVTINGDKNKGFCIKSIIAIVIGSLISFIAIVMIALEIASCIKRRKPTSTTTDVNTPFVYQQNTTTQTYA